MRPGSPQRRLPIVTLIEAEALAAAGEPDRAIGALERVVAAIGVDEAHDLRAGVSGRLSWPLPAELRPQPARPPGRRGDRPRRTIPPSPTPTEGDARRPPRGDVSRRRGWPTLPATLPVATPRCRSPSGSIRTLAGDGVAILEPTLGGQPAQERLLLYGDLLRAAGRRVEADQAYDRAADRRS